MARQIKFRKILHDHRKKVRSMPLLAGMIIAILWLMMYLHRIATTQ